MPDKDPPTYRHETVFIGGTHEVGSMYLASDGWHGYDLLSGKWIHGVKGYIDALTRIKDNARGTAAGYEIEKRNAEWLDGRG